MITDETILDCGHTPTKPRSAMTTGYGIDPDGRTTRCYDCCLAWEKDMMRKTGRVFAYLSKPKNGPAKITTWPGGLISDDVCIMNNANGSFGHWSDKGFYVRFCFDGKVWAGYCRGIGMYLRARVTKIKRVHMWRCP